MWLRRIIDGDGDGDGARVAQAPWAVAQAERVAAVLERRGGIVDTATFDVLRAAVADDPSLAPATLQLLARALHDTSAEAVGLQVPEGDDLEAHAAFWEQLARRFPDDAYVAAFAGETLLQAGRVEAGVERLLAAMEREPPLFGEFGEEVAAALDGLGTAAPGGASLRLALIGLRSALEDVEGDEFDEVRERYSELLDEYHADPDALAAIREVGARIRELEADERLPRALVRRGPSRRPGEP